MIRMPFIPPKLPPKIDYTSLITEIGDARDALGQLRGLLINIPNPGLLTTPLITKEAVLSSRIEGTHATLEDVLRYEAERKSSQKEEIEKDAREIINYRRAMQVGIEELKRKPIGENLIKRLHYILLDSARGANKDRGNFRRIQVYIAPPGTPLEKATYIPPPFTEFPNLLSNWEEYINSDKEKDPLVQIAVTHYQFEAIHPFIDGNGRIGRLLIPLFLYQKKILPYPLLYVSEFFEANRKDYYGLLSQVSEASDWNRWIRFFLQALIIQSNKTNKLILEMLELYNVIKNIATTVRSSYAIKLLDIIFSSPIVTFASIKKQIKTKSNQTIYDLLNKFVKLDILEEAEQRKRNRIYVFKKLMDILK